MGLRKTVPLYLCYGILLLSASSCSRVDQPAETAQTRYRVTVLQHGIEARALPEGHAADFDADGTRDRVTVTSTSLTVAMSGGAEFQYRFDEEPWDPGLRLDDIAVVDLDGDGRYPSIVLATRRFDPEFWGLPAQQLAVVNDHGHLTLKRLWQYSVPAVTVDCASIVSSVLPVCFYGTYSVRDVGWGVSGLIELDVTGWRRLAADSVANGYALRDINSWMQSLEDFAEDSAFLSHHRLQWGMGEASARELVIRIGIDAPTYDRLVRSSVPAEAHTTGDTVAAVLGAFIRDADPLDLVRTRWRMTAHECDSILSEWGVSDSASALDMNLALHGWFQEADEWILARDVTRRSGLPWPAQWPPFRPSSDDGKFISGAQFFDFTGDGLDDLVGVGWHSRIFTAVQHDSGVFVDSGYHSDKEERIGVWAPRIEPGSTVAFPPCVYFVLERAQANRYSDYVECYDRTIHEWYEVRLPGGDYAMDTEWGPDDEPSDGSPYTLRHAVPFWDFNQDGMIDFAARTSVGTWNVLTFVPVEEGANRSTAESTRDQL